MSANRIRQAAMIVAIAVLGVQQGHAATYFFDTFDAGAAQWTVGNGTWAVCQPPGIVGYRYCPSNTHRFGHIVLVTLENHSASEVLGSPYLAYFNSLAARFAIAENFYANVHPSAPKFNTCRKSPQARRNSRRSRRSCRTSRLPTQLASFPST